MASGDLGISHMGIALMVVQIGQWRKELCTLNSITISSDQEQESYQTIK
jgi:hypothetical protein